MAVRFTTRRLFLVTTFVAVASVLVASEIWIAEEVQGPESKTGSERSEVIAVARRWLTDKGAALKAANFDAELYDGNWLVVIELEPPVQGNHILLKINSSMEVQEVIYGR